MKKIFFVILLPLLLASCHHRQETTVVSTLADDFSNLLDSLDESEQTLMLSLYHDYAVLPHEKLADVLHWVDSTKHDYVQLVGGVRSYKNGDFDECARLLEVLQKEERCLAEAVGETNYDFCMQCNGQYALQTYSNALRSSMILRTEAAFRSEMVAYATFHEKWTDLCYLLGITMYYGGSFSTWSGMGAVCQSTKPRVKDLDVLLKSLEFVHKDFNQTEMDSGIVSLSVADQTFRSTLDSVHGKLVEYIRETIELYTDDIDKEAEYAERNKECREELAEMIASVDKLSADVLKYYEKWYMTRLSLNLDYTHLNETSRGVFTPVFYLNRTAWFVQDLTGSLKDVSGYLFEEDTCNSH